MPTWLLNSNKQALADEIKRLVNVDVDPYALFDVQIKRLHEYKRPASESASYSGPLPSPLENPITAWFLGIYFWRQGASL